MAQNVYVVGLFEDSNTAATAIQELISSGFRRDDINAMSGAGAGSDLQSQIMRLGAPENEAQFYAQGVQNGGTLLTMRTTEDRADEATAIMNRMGVRHMGDQSAHMGDQSAHMAATQSAGTAATHSAQGEVTIPIVEEQLQVGKRAVERGGVRIYSHIEEVPIEQQVQLREEEVTVERRPVNRAVTETDMAAMQQGTIEVIETDEVAVVSKQARVVEEVVVGKQATERTETVRDTVRRTEVDVEELDRDDTEVMQSDQTTNTTSRR